MTGIEKKPGKTKIALKRLIDTCLSALGVALLAIPFGVIALAKRTPRVVSTPS